MTVSDLPCVHPSVTEFTGPQGGMTQKADPIIQSTTVEESAAQADDGEGGAENLLDSTKKISKEDFEFLKVVGRGSFGKVYMVKKKDRPTDVYAIKVLDKSVLKKRNLLIKTQGKFPPHAWMHYKFS